MVGSLAKRAKTASKSRGISPRDVYCPVAESLAPSIEKVFPEPVWPYARIVELKPLRSESSATSPISAKTSSCVDSIPNTLSKVKRDTSALSSRLYSSVLPFSTWKSGSWPASRPNIGRSRAYTRGRVALPFGMAGGRKINLRRKWQQGMIRWPTQVRMSTCLLGMDSSSSGNLHVAQNVAFRRGLDASAQHAYSGD